MRVSAIADELRCSQKTVRRWLKRFHHAGPDGLQDLGGQGRRRRITEADQSRIIGLVKKGRPGGRRCGSAETCGRPKSRGRRSGRWTRWLRPPGRWGSRSAAPRCAGARRHGRRH
ncbi:hypothetical protein BOG92_000435 [Streptomyces sp. WAC00263]|nr:hypothetical protein BOG92_000435 [Streptomyces sp. WAC00263]